MGNPRGSGGDGGSVYFDLQADMGITKHMGGRRATRELLELCQVQEGQYVLEVGCGLGRTACAMAREGGCRVVGVDSSERMVARSRERARRQGMGSRVQFTVADAQELPFDGALFDVVVDESVTAFVKDKGKAVSEYVRVVKSGGHVGLNEVTWMRTPSPELVEYLSLVMGQADFLTSGGWKELLEGSGLGDLTVRSYAFDARRQFVEEVRQLDLRETMGGWYRLLTQSVANPAYREFVKQVMSAPRNLFRFVKYVGYGIYVGRK